MSWQPIETAPTCKRVLVGDRFGIDIAKFMNGEWLFDHGGQGFWPTHWMPLPEPPA